MFILYLRWLYIHRTLFFCSSTLLSNIYPLKRAQRVESVVSTSGAFFWVGPSRVSFSFLLYNIHIIIICHDSLSRRANDHYDYYYRYYSLLRPLLPFFYYLNGARWFFYTVECVLRLQLLILMMLILMDFKLNWFELVRSYGAYMCEYAWLRDLYLCVSHQPVMCVCVCACKPVRYARMWAFSHLISVMVVRCCLPLH